MLADDNKSSTAHKLQDTAGGNVPDHTAFSFVSCGGVDRKAAAINPSLSSEKRDTGNPEAFTNKGIGIGLRHLLVPLAQDSL